MTAGERGKMAKFGLPAACGLMVLCVLLGAGGCGSSSTSTGAVLAVASVFGAPGQTVAVPVSLTGATSPTGFNLVLSYDAGNLTLTSVTKGAGLPTAATFTNSSTPGTVNVTLSGTTAFITSPVAQLLVMNFVFSSLSNTGTVNPITVTSATVTNAAGTSLAINPISGSITSFP